MRKISLTFALACLWGCRAYVVEDQMGKQRIISKNELAAYEAIAEVKKVHAPDKRVALFDVKPSSRKDQITIKGETNEPEAKVLLQSVLLAKGVTYKDSIQILPASDLGEQTKALVTISVANLRSEGRHAAELASQATLGTPLSVLKKAGEWYLVQTPDRYISWVDHGAIKLLTPTELEAWQKMPKLIYLKTYGFAYAAQKADEGATVSDLVAGDIVQLKAENSDFYQVQYPDGRTAYVAKTEAQPYDQWLAALKPGEETLVQTAKRMMGVPYLWGGTSFKAVDCSGFTRMIYFMNGMLLPRDASQQVHTGTEVDASNGFDKLQVGDLLFFGKPAIDSTAEKVTHVAMWIGNNEFIHASGRVQINSVVPGTPNYDAFNRNRFLRAKRMLKAATPGIVQLKGSGVF